MKELDTIREAIEGLLEAANHNVGGMVPGVVATWCHKALATLSTIDPDAKPQEPSGDVKVFTAILVENLRKTNGFIDRAGMDRAAALIISHDDAIRREFYERIKLLPYPNDNPTERRIGDIYAILGTKPARESSRPISFDGWFYIFTDQTTGKLESFSSYKNAAAALDKILATEPAREGLE